MPTRSWSKVIIVLFLCVFLGSGCRLFRSKKGAQDLEALGLEDWDTPLPERFEDGARVTDVQFDRVRFAYDSYQIDNSEVPKIESVAAYMRETPRVRAIVEGHCDERGSREYNMSLGEHRALAVRAYLTGLGIDGGRIQTRSYGEESPLVPGHDQSSWRANRRGEFALYR